MSEKQKNDGGQAFPRTGYLKHEASGMTTFPQEGMTLRAWFAGKALSGMELTTMDDLGIKFFYSGYEVAERAYEIADAMIAHGLKK